MRINLRQIEVFRAIMLTSSISGAAKLLHVSQPAVSRLLSYTEQRLGLKLFERIKGRLYPTPEAKRLFTEVNAVYQGVQRVNEVADDLIQQRAGHLRIACSSSFGQSRMPHAISRFYEEYPDVEIILRTMSPELILQALLTQEAELGIAYLPTRHPNLQSQHLYDNDIVAVIPETHPLAKRDSLHIEDLIDQPLIGYSSDLPFGQLIRQLFDQAEQVLHPRVEVGQAHVAYALVQAGIGIALVDEQTIEGSQWTGVVIRPMTPAICAPIDVFYPLYEPLSQPAQKFITVLQQLKP